ncbi:hypothetical protein FACS1894180_6310 [Bacteroidia bacterium]|nr:hypothetical protein FACS1894180_6310 [Bacteroidia bacterium]
MGLFNFFKKKSDTQKIVTNEKDIEIGTKVLLLNIGNRIDYQTAKKIFIETATVAKISTNFNINELSKILLSKYRSINFTEGEIDAYYQFLSAFAKTKNPINVSNSSDDFYDKMFEKILNSNLFAMPQYACFVTEKKEIYADGKDNYAGIVSSYAYLWLRNVANKNKLLYKHILSLIPNDLAIPFEEQKSLISITLAKLDQLYEDKNAVYQIYNRIKVYLQIINRFTNELLEFYAEHEKDINYFLSRANQDYLPTKKIQNVAQLTIQDIDHIFIRDMLNEKVLL